jgi:outer membrane protein
MKLFSCALIFLLLAEAASGATLVELQQMALQNRKLVAKYRAKVTISEEDETIARSGYYPAVDLSYTANRLANSGLFESRQNSVAYAALSWNLFAGYRDMNTVRSAKLLRRAEGYRLQGIEQDIQLNVALRYLAIFVRQTNLRVAEDQHNTLLKTY